MVEESTESNLSEESLRRVELMKSVCTGIRHIQASVQDNPHIHPDLQWAINQTFKEALKEHAQQLEPDDENPVGRPTFTYKPTDSAISALQGVLKAMCDTLGRYPTTGGRDLLRFMAAHPMCGSEAMRIATETLAAPRDTRQGRGGLGF